MSRTFNTRKVVLYFSLISLLLSSIILRLYLDYFDNKSKIPVYKDPELSAYYQSQIERFFSSDGNLIFFLGTKKCLPCKLLKKRIESIVVSPKKEVIFFIPNSPKEDFILCKTLYDNKIYVNFVPTLLQFKEGKIKRYWGYNKDNATISSENGEQIKLSEMMKIDN